MSSVCAVCHVCRFDSCTPCHLFDFSVISAPFSCLAVVFPVLWLSRCLLPARMEAKQNKTRQIKIKILSKSDFPSAWFSCQLSFSMNTLLHLRPCTHRHTNTQTDTHTCMHICQCKCVSAWLHRCHQFYLTSALFRITRFNVSLKCVNELTIRGSQAPLSPTTHTHTYAQHVCEGISSEQYIQTMTGHKICMWTHSRHTCPEPWGASSPPAETATATLPPGLPRGLPSSLSVTPSLTLIVDVNVKINNKYFSH